MEEADDTLMMYSNLFGRPDLACYPVLYELNETLFMFFALVKRVLRDICGHHAPYSQRWQEVLTFLEVFQALAQDPCRSDGADAYRKATGATV